MLAVLTFATAWAAEIRLPEVQVRAGEAVALPVTLDHAENLAGIKLAVSYDPALLTFRAASKTALTGSMMQVVNDRRPGNVIVVMASARGVRVTGEAILLLTFAATASLPERRETEIGFATVELMSDRLQQIAATAIPCRLTLIP
jgi:hypothetical protein